MNALATTLTIGTHYPALGGTLGAIVARPDGSTYGLIVADAVHEYTGTWGQRGQDIPGATGTDGAANTQAMAEAGSQAALYVRALAVDGHADWFIGSRMQMRLLAEFAPQLFDQDGWYWTSSQSSRHYAWIQVFEYGYSNLIGKGSEFRVRPLRSIQLQPFTPSTLVAAGDGGEILAGAAA